MRRPIDITDFLTNLADKLEDHDPDALVPACQVFTNNKTSTSDPMDGVLTAMGATRRRRWSI